MSARAAFVAALERLTEILTVYASWCGDDTCERCENVPAIAAARARVLGGLP